jgi:hypothetical protein
MVYNGTLADCIRELLAKPIRQISPVRSSTGRGAALT